MQSRYAQRIGRVKVEAACENVIIAIPHVLQRGREYKAVLKNVRVNLTKDGPAFVVEWAIQTSKKKRG